MLKLQMNLILLSLCFSADFIVVHVFRYVHDRRILVGPRTAPTTQKRKKGGSGFTNTSIECTCMSDTHRRDKSSIGRVYWPCSSKSRLVVDLLSGTDTDRSAIDRS